MLARLCVVCVVWLVVMTPAVRAATPSPEMIAKAKRHYQLGIAAYAKDDYETALRELTLAYEESQRPDILFNLARVETKLGHDAKAITYLERYLELKPNAEDAAAVYAEIEARQKALAAHKGEQAARAEATQARRDEQAVRASAGDALRYAPHNRAAIGLTVIGGAVLVAGVVLGVVALQASSSVEHGAGMPVQFAGSSFAANESTGRTVSPVGIAFDVVGAAALATGVGLLVWRRVAANRPERAWLAPTLRGLAVAGTF